MTCSCLMNKEGCLLVRLPFCMIVQSMLLMMGGLQPSVYLYYSVDDIAHLIICSVWMQLQYSQLFYLHTRCSSLSMYRYTLYNYYNIVPCCDSALALLIQQALVAHWHWRHSASSWKNAHLPKDHNEQINENPETAF